VRLHCHRDGGVRLHHQPMGLHAGLEHHPGQRRCRAVPAFAAGSDWSWSTSTTPGCSPAPVVRRSVPLLLRSGTVLAVRPATDRTCREAVLKLASLTACRRPGTDGRDGNQERRRGPSSYGVPLSRWPAGQGLRGRHRDVPEERPLRLDRGWLTPGATRHTD
jgi:hypothetical protein